MKYFYLLLIAILAIQTTESQIINFPDANFKSTLLNQPTVDQNGNGNYDSYVDTNFDGEIQISEAEVVTALKISSSQITSLEGIQYFTNLEVLDCNRNDLTSLDPLDELSGLLSLNCGWNPLTSSESIIVLTNLNWLMCDNNDLTQLDLSSFSNLEFLDCSKNDITTLNLTGASSIETLKCFDNMLTTLDVNNLTTLKYISCNQNQITELIVNALVNLEELQCTSNALSSLDVSGLENLSDLKCRYNSLTTLNVSNTTNLSQLDARYNQLSSLDLSDFGNLNIVRLDDNNLTSLVVGSSIETLYCNNNQLTTLDFTDSPNLRWLECNSNSLTSLFVKNGKDENQLAFANNPNLEFICADNFQLEEIQDKIDLFGYNAVVNSYCSFNPGGTYFTVSGNNILDLDSNGCDVSDMPFPNLKFSIDNGIDTYQEITDDSGNYELNVEEGSYTITPILENPDYFSISPTSITVNTSAETSPYIQDFCITANGTMADLEIVLIPLINAVPGFNTNYKLIYRNKGNTILSGVIDFTFQDNVMDLVSADPLPDAQNTNLLNWNYSNLLPLEQRHIDITMNISAPTDTPPLNLGDILQFTATINPVPGDEAPDDNVFILDQTVVGSYDPNDKTCLEGEAIAPELVGEFVHYLIRFENTGTANAINVVVKDIIDTAKYDISTMLLTDSSHTLETKIENDVVEFIFENINLPFDDANNDGYVAFKIKTLDSLIEGDTFENDAEIFFDFNFPIDTNIAQTVIQEPLNLPKFNTIGLEIYPNPVNDILTIKGKNTIQAVTIYDVLGRQINHIEFLGVNKTVVVITSNLVRGSYFVKVRANNIEAIETLIKK